jgi:hypothetical protein
MNRLIWVTFVSIGALSTGLLLAAGCSSTSSSTAPQAEAGAEASVEAAASLPDAGDAGDAAEAGTVSITWKAVAYNAKNFATPLPGDGGPDADSDGGAVGDATAPADAEAQDASGDGGGDGGVPGVPGVQVCVYPQAGPVPAPGAATGNCVTSDANGEFVLRGLPVRTNLAVTLNKAGFTPGLLSIQTASTPADYRGRGATMYPTSLQTDMVPPVTLDLQNKGQIDSFIVALGGKGLQGQPGVTVSMSPMSGHGPVYLDQNENYAPSATAFVDNAAQFLNVDPGLYTLTFVHPTDPTMDCEPFVGGLVPFAAYGFPVVTPTHSLQVLVAPGYISGLVGAFCTTKPTIVAVDGG